MLSARQATPSAARPQNQRGTTIARSNSGDEKVSSGNRGSGNDRHSGNVGAAHDKSAVDGARLSDSPASRSQIRRNGEGEGHAAPDSNADGGTYPNLGFRVGIAGPPGAGKSSFIEVQMLPVQSPDMDGLMRVIATRVHSFTPFVQVNV